MTELLYHVECSDALAALQQIETSTIDAIVTDPPAGISFMGKAWDGDKGGRKQWTAWLESVMRECLRVLKPGGYCLVWALPRTSHWTGSALEDAGFEVRDCVTHIFGSGFPKSLNVSKAIDAADGLKDAREVVSTYTAGGNAGVSTADKGGTYGVGVGTAPAIELAITRGASERSRQWDGWGTALKPAAEMWWLVRKPLVGTVAANVLAHGTGGLNIDGCRIGTTDNLNGGRYSDNKVGDDGASYGAGINLRSAAEYAQPAGRWPANVALSHAEGCGRLDAARAEWCRGFDVRTQTMQAALSGPPVDDLPTPQIDDCAPDCPVAMLDAQSGVTTSQGGSRGSGGQHGTYSAIGAQDIKPGKGDSGGASRFFYVAKPSTKEREAGLDHLPKRAAAELVEREDGAAALDCPRTGAGRTSKGRANHHPTVKSIALMRWLVRLITPPGGIVLDPFTGSGTTGCAAVLEGCHFIGVEQDPEYVAIASARIAHWMAK